ncbi:MAG: hypothetical protein ABI867_00575 [Kofleriaceae bacterium]
MNAPARYLKELRNELSLYPTWLPSDRIELGTYGRLEQGRFVVDGRLSDLKIEVKPKTTRTAGNLRKSHGVKFSGSAKANADAAPVDLSLGVDIELEREHAWIFAARGIDTVEVENIAELRREILEAHKRGDWERRWLVVTEYRKVEVLDVVVARSNHAKLRATAKGVLAAADVLLGVDAALAVESGDVFSVVNQKNATPLYGLRKLRGFIEPGLESMEEETFSLCLNEPFGID